MKESGQTFALNERRLTPSELAKEFGFSWATIENFLRAHGENPDKMTFNVSVRAIRTYTTVGQLEKMGLGILNNIQTV